MAVNKGKADLRVPSKEGKKTYESIKWNQYCPGCSKVLCSCKIKGNKKRAVNENTD